MSSSPPRKKQKETTRDSKDSKDHKEEKVSKPIKCQPSPRFTLCVPSTCISRTNCKNLEQATHVAYQIAKGACTYNVGEIVILQIPTDESEQRIRKKPTDNAVKSLTDSGAVKKKFDEPVYKDEDVEMKEVSTTSPTKETKETKSNEDNFSSDSLLLASLLQFFVTPPYLLKSTFKDKKIMDNFHYAKKLPKISTLPFMQNTSDQFKEGLTIYKNPPKREKTLSGKVKKMKQKITTTKYVNIGESALLELVNEVPTNVRVTVNINKRQIVSPLDAYGVSGAKASFGYHVRISKSFLSLFTEASYPEGYNKSIYINSGDYFFNNSTVNEKVVSLKDISVEKNDKLILLVVSKWKDLNSAFKKDKSQLEGVSGPEQMFDGKLNMPTGTRIEDGSLIALSKLSQ